MPLCIEPAGYQRLTSLPEAMQRPLANPTWLLCIAVHLCHPLYHTSRCAPNPAANALGGHSEQCMVQQGITKAPLAQWLERWSYEP
jgi:hypothetical protein